MIRIPTSKIPNVFVDVRQDLVYASSWPSRLVRPIWRVKRALKRAYATFRRFSYAIAHYFLGDPDFDVKNAMLFLNVRQDLVYAYSWTSRLVRQDLVYAYGWPSRLVRLIRKVKRAPKQAYPSFRRFSCAIAHHFLGDLDSNVNNAKFFRGRPSRPCLCI